MKLTIVDKGVIPRGQTHGSMLRCVIQTARTAEAVGFHRYWVAENHHSGCSFSAAEVMVTVLAGVTSRIRVGAAGMLMLYHNPWRVAEAFRLLEALFPGRIDLGVTSGMLGSELEQGLVPGFDSGAAKATDLYARRVERLMELNQQTMPIARPSRPLVFRQAWPQFSPRAVSAPTIPSPADRAGPPVILLASGQRAAPAILAARNGGAFCCRVSSDYLGTALDVARQYREAFRPSIHFEKPQLMIAANFICGETVPEAARMLQTYRQNSGDEPATFIGNPERCLQKMGDLLDQFGTDEIALFPLYSSLEDRLRGITLLAGAAGVHPHAVAARSHA